MSLACSLTVLEFILNFGIIAIIVIIVQADVKIIY